MPTKPSTAPATKSLDPVAATAALLEDTPELANPLAERGAITLADGKVYIDGTTDVIHNIGDYIMNFAPAKNAYLSALVNRIGFVIISSKMYTNPWADFKKGRLEFGETIEEIFVNLCKPLQFSPSKAEQDVFKRTIPDVRAAFHTMDFQKYYPITISNDQLRQAFLSWQGITDLIAAIVDSVYASAQTDEYLMMKYMLAKCILNGNIQSIKIPDVTGGTEDDLRSAVAIMRATSKKLEYQSKLYTMTDVTTHTPLDEQRLILTADFDSESSVQVLARAYNLDYSTFMGRVIGIDSFVEYDWERLTWLFTNEEGEVDPNFHVFTEDELAVLGSVPAVMTSIRFWQCWDVFETMTENYNGKGLYWNYNYHVWKIFSVSPFAQCVAYSTLAKSVTGVTVSPTTATLSPGASLQITAAVATTGVTNKAVTWTLTGNASTATQLSATGLLQVGKDETAASLTVTATSVADTTKSAAATITVTQPAA